jgi:hypothetical protein
MPSQSWPILPNGAQHSGLSGCRVKLGTLYSGFMSEIGRVLIGLGVAIALIGVVILLLGKTGIPLGRLPGDFLWRGKNTSMDFPLGTSIVLSVLLSLVFYILARLRR